MIFIWCVCVLLFGVCSHSNVRGAYNILRRCEFITDIFAIPQYFTRICKKRNEGINGPTDSITRKTLNAYAQRMHKTSLETGKGIKEKPI